MSKDVRMTPKEAEQLAKKMIEHSRKHGIPMKRIKNKKKEV